MKKLICQLWKRCNNDGENIVEGYSLHLNNKQRLLFLNKNFSRLSGSEGTLSVKSYYSCEVENGVYEDVIKKQIKHGLMVTSGGAPKKTNQYSGKPGGFTVQFSEVRRILTDLSDMSFKRGKYEFIETETKVEDAE